jgi:ribosomal protein S12 methylthiotransferase
MSARKIHFVSLGCVKNRVDTEVMLGVANRDGWSIVDEADEAEVIVVNTCGFIGEAKKESIDTILELSEYKRVGSCKKLVVTGLFGSALRSRSRRADARGRPPARLERHAAPRRGARRRRGARARGEPGRLARAGQRPARRDSIARQRVGQDRGRVQSDLFLLRHSADSGKQRSRSADDIVAEAERLVAQGALELNLVSQDTIAWGRDQPRADRSPLAELVRRIADVKGVRWVRLFYLYPETIDDALIDLLAATRAWCRTSTCLFSTPPTQCSRECARGHGRDRQKRVVERLRERVPGLTMRTAFIVGHPGETESEFDELCAFVKWARFEHAVVFRYSDEETCASRELPGKVPALVAANRSRKLMAMQRRIAREKNRALVGSELEVLVEGASEEHELVMKGRHAGQAPEIDGSVYLSEGEARPGEMRRVRITHASDWDLVGDLLGQAAPTPAKKRVALKMLGHGT